MPTHFSSYSLTGKIRYSTLSSLALGKLPIFPPRICEKQIPFLFKEDYEMCIVIGDSCWVN